MICLRNQISLCDLFLLNWLLILVSDQSYWHTIHLSLPRLKDPLLWGSFSFSKFYGGGLVLFSVKITLLIFSFLFLWFSFYLCHSIPELFTKITYYLGQNINDGNNFQNLFHEFCENCTCLTELFRYVPVSQMTSNYYAWNIWGEQSSKRGLSQWLWTQCH